jgi:hypothetical protein
MPVTIQAITVPPLRCIAWLVLFLERGRSHPVSQSAPPGCRGRPERTGEPDLGEVGRSAGRVATSVAAIEPARIPVLSQFPQSGDVEAGTAVGCVMSGEGVVEAVVVAVDALVLARVHDVIPNVSHRGGEVHNLVGLWRLASGDVPGVSFSAVWASGGDEGVGFVGDEASDSKGVPGASAPPDRGGAHHRESEVPGGEGMGQNDTAAVVQNEIASGVQRKQPVRDLLRGELKRRGEVFGGLDAAVASQLVLSSAWQLRLPR